MAHGGASPCLWGWTCRPGRFGQRGRGIPPLWGWTTSSHSTPRFFRYSPFVGVGHALSVAGSMSKSYSPVHGGGPDIAMLDPQVLSPYKGVDRAPLEALIRGIRIPPSWGWADRLQRISQRDSVIPPQGVDRPKMNAHKGADRSLLDAHKGVDRNHRQSRRQGFPRTWGWTVAVWYFKTASADIPPSWGWTDARCVILSPF